MLLVVRAETTSFDHDDDQVSADRLQCSARRERGYYLLSEVVPLTACITLTVGQLQDGYTAHAG